MGTKIGDIFRLEDEENDKDGCRYAVNVFCGGKMESPYSPEDSSNDGRQQLSAPHLGTRRAMILAGLSKNEQKQV